MRVFLPFTVLCLLTGSAAIARERAGNWSANDSACDGHSELLKKGALKIGVRFSTSNPALQTACARALDFWAIVLDMEWHEDDSHGCAIQIVDGRPDLFIPVEIARAQLPNRRGFQGRIAFNPAASLPASEQFFVAVHELGHLLGLPHNPSASSIMFYLNVDEPFVLDKADLTALAAIHKLRIDGLDQPLPVIAPSVTERCCSRGASGRARSGRRAMRPWDHDRCPRPAESARSSRSGIRRRSV